MNMYMDRVIREDAVGRVTIELNPDEFTHLQSIIRLALAIAKVIATDDSNLDENRCNRAVERIENFEID